MLAGGSMRWKETHRGVEVPLAVKQTRRSSESTKDRARSAKVLVKCPGFLVLATSAVWIKLMARLSAAASRLSEAVN